MSDAPQPPPAGLLRRLAAVGYDALLLTSVLFLATVVLLMFTGGKAIENGNPLYTLYLLAVSYAYFGYFWCHGGQTLGLKAWKLKVVRSNGGPLTWQVAGLRFLAAMLSLMVSFLGFLWAVVDPAGLMWHDRLSGSRIIRIEHGTEVN